MRIGFVVWKLCAGKGGLERLGATLVRSMEERGHETVVFCQKNDDLVTPVYPIGERSVLIPLGLSDSPALLAEARRLIVDARLDVLCALFSWDALLWFPSLLNNTGVPFLISEHSHPGIIEGERWNRYERRACLAAADRIHLLNNDFRAMLPEFLRKRAVVIPNPAEPPCARDREKGKKEGRRLLGMGRMQENPKQFSLLIHAFSMLAKAFPDWDLWLCGDGDNRGDYLRLAERLNLQDRIHLPGNVEDVDSHYASADIFCIPSRYEGFGLATVEAQRHGLPAVGFAGCSGTNEIIVHEKNGFLAPEMTAASLAETLRPLLFSDALRRKMGECGQQMLERYKKEDILDRWEALLLETAGCKDNTRLRVPSLTDRQASENALAEIVNRKTPFLRPVCAGLQREIEMQQHALNQAFALLRQHGVLPQRETA